jgi:Domain of unknown function (DUF4160)
MNDIERLGRMLNYIFANTVVLANGIVVEQRELLEKIGGLKIEIYPNEHPPPHFHVKSNDFNISIDILTGEILKGKLENNAAKKIKYYHMLHKAKLIEAWNRLRPTNCPVGKINL